MSPTYERFSEFDRDWSKLTGPQRKLFKAAVEKFRDDLAKGQFRKGLRVKRVQGTSGVFEMTFAPDGRAPNVTTTWQFGGEVVEGEMHIIWRRIGTHEIFNRP